MPNGRVIKNKKEGKMKTVIAIRNGKETLRAQAEERNGVLQGRNNILLNADLVTASGLGKDYIAGEVRAGRLTPQIEAMGMRLGDNGNGLVCRWLDAPIAEQQAEAKKECDALPNEALPDEEQAAKEERAEISKLYVRSSQALNFDLDGDNISRGYSLRAKADRRLEAWRAKYPAEARKEESARLIAQAEHEEDLAAGALVYDADGWIGPEEQQRRHDEVMAKAQELRAKAAELAK